MNTDFRRSFVAILLFTSFGMVTEPVHAGTFSLGPLTRYETFSDLTNGNRVPLEPPDKVYIHDYAVEHKAYLFAGVDGETVTMRFTAPDGHTVAGERVFDAGEDCWKEGRQCRVVGDGTLTVQLLLANSPQTDLGLWVYDLLNNGVVVYTENFTLVTPELSIAGGNNQEALPGQMVPHQLEVRLLNDDGVTPLTSESVRFEITGSPRIGNNDTPAFLTANGTGTGSTTLNTITDSAGYAHVFLTLGSVMGGYQVTATSSKAPFDTPIFSATAKDPTEEDADDDKENGDPECEKGVGNPINVTTGNKYQRETDLTAVAPALLAFDRHYNSKDPLFADMGRNWRHTYDRSVATVTTGKGGSATTTAYVRRPDGKRFTYVETDGIWVTDPDVHHTLTQDASGWTFKEDNNSERFGLDGKLASITYIDGRSIQLTYSAATGLLESVDDDMGSWLQFTHNVDGRTETVTDQALRTWRYSYDTDGNLISVENPDLTTRQYHYENLNFPHALTGITDERGVRYATFEYNIDGLATASYHAGNVGRVDVDYSGGGLRVVTNSRSNASTYVTLARHGSGKVGEMSGPGCGTCTLADSTYQYDASNNLVAKTSKGVTTRYGGYGSGDHPGYVITAPGTVNERRVYFSYDTRFDGLIKRRIAPSVSEVPNWYHGTNITYDDFGHITRIVDNGYTPGWSPESVALAPRVANFNYNGPVGQLSRVDGPRTDVNDVVTLDYYPNDLTEGSNRARLKRVTNGLGQIIRNNIEYTATGRILSENRANGLTVSYTYFAGSDRLETVTESAGVVSRVTRWTYLASGEVESITEGNGSVDATTLFFEYDDARRLIGIRDGLGNLRKFVLNLEGDIESEELYDPALLLRKSIQSVFDSYDRLQSQSSANESIARTYNFDSSLATETDGKNITYSFTYDDVKRLTSTTATIDGAAKTVAIDYYEDTEETTAITPPATLATNYATDDFGNLLSESSPSTGVTTRSHDEAGNVLQMQDNSGQLFFYQYDALNRVLSVDAPGTADDISYTYDTCANGVGRLCSVATPSGTVLYTYNGFGDVASSQNVSRTYDAVGRTKSMTYPSGAVVGYSYDAAGQLESLQLNSGPLISSITHAPFGPASGWLYANGLTYSATFDTAYRPLLQQTPGVLQRAYDSYDGNGNLLQMTETIDGVPTINLFTYTDDNRLLTASGLFGIRAYGYSPNGNRESLDNGTEVLPYGNSNDQLYRIGEPPQVIGGGDGGPQTLIPGTSVNDDFTDDARGNRTTRIENEWTCIETVTPDPRTGGDITTYECTESVARSWVYEYSSDNRLRSVIVDGAVLASYAYDGLGQRIRKTLADGTAIQYVYDLDGSLLAELDGAGTVLREYIYLDRAPVAMRDLSAGTETVYYIHNDHLGTPKAMSNSVGTVVWRASHDPFGQATVDEDPDGNAALVTMNIRFPGQYYDQETGLHYNYYRTYDPNTGRYLESDPIGLDGGLNTFVYVSNNPLAFSDRFGLQGARPAPRPPNRHYLPPEQRTRSERDFQRLLESIQYNSQQAARQRAETRARKRLVEAEQLRREEREMVENIDEITKEHLLPTVFDPLADLRKYLEISNGVVVLEKSCRALSQVRSEIGPIKFR